MSHFLRQSLPKPHSCCRRGYVAALFKALVNEGRDMEMEHFQAILKMGKGRRVRSSLVNGLIYLDAK